MVGSDTEGRVASLKVPVFMASALADAWLADALLEHASVASFARFTMELLAVGAPLDMIADAQKAGLDEVAHAEACFELAHAHAPLHPKAAAGPLSLRELTIRDSLAEVAAAAVIEGCCGETVAALALARASAFCTNPRTKAILAQIAEDEARHAELAFRFVAWAVATGADEVRSAVRLAFERERSSLVTACEAPLQTDASDEARGWRSAGRLTDRDLADVRREAANLLLEPAAKLLGQSESYIC